jgi:hypothetical protein
MRRGIIALALMCIVTGVMATPASPIVPANVVTFKNWAVGCDNGLDCQAVALTTEDGVESKISLVLKRAGGTGGALDIEISGFIAKVDRYRILVDGKVADTGPMFADNEVIKIAGPDALKLARRMANGKTLKLLDGAGVELGQASLSGASAAFRYTDAAQGRAGTKDAVIAVGRKRAAAKNIVIPIITAQRIKPDNILPDASALVALSESSPCADERLGSTEDTAYGLGHKDGVHQALVLLNCGSGAYNFSVGAYVGQQGATGKWSFAPAKFDYPPGGVVSDNGLPLLINADWNGTTQSLSTYTKARGLGDCGRSEGYVWDGSIFRLTSATLMDECRGSLDWIPVWRAEVKLEG